MFLAGRLMLQAAYLIAAKAAILLRQMPAAGGRPGPPSSPEIAFGGVMLASAWAAGTDRPLACAAGDRSGRFAVVWDVAGHPGAFERDGAAEVGDAAAGDSNRDRSPSVPSTRT